MFQNFPYTDMHQLNLDWIISVVKEFEDHYTTLHETIDAGIAAINELADAKEADIESLTAEKISSLNSAYNNYATLLTNLYNDYKDDLDTEVAAALRSFTTQITSELATFNTTVENKLATTLASIPDDYSTLSATVTTLENTLNLLIVPETTDWSEYLYLENKYYNTTTREYTTLNGWNLYRIPLGQHDVVMVYNPTAVFWGTMSNLFIAQVRYRSQLYSIAIADGTNRLGCLSTGATSKARGHVIAVPGPLWASGDFLQICIKADLVDSTLLHINGKNPSLVLPQYVKKIETATEVTEDIADITPGYQSGYSTDNNSCFYTISQTIDTDLVLLMLPVSAGDMMTASAIGTGYSLYGMYYNFYTGATVSVNRVPFTFDNDGIFYAFKSDNKITYIPKECIKIPYKDVLFTPDKVLEGKTIAFLGDSIVYQDLYPSSVVDYVGGTKVNLGIGSSPLSGDSATAFWRPDRINSVKAANPDVLVILGGANDLVLNPVLGTDNDLNTKDTSTFIGAYSYIIDTLLTWKPSLKIFIVTTTYAHNNGAGYGTNLRYSDFANACIKVADFYKIPCVDLYHQGCFNSYTMGTGTNAVYSADQIHPNTAGAKIMASITCAKIREILSIP